MAAELPRPGVEIIQEFRTVSPTVISPTLVPNVVGVCKQIVELLETDSSGSSVLNQDAVVVLPGFFVAKNPVSGIYAGLDTLLLAFTVNNGPTVTVTFADPVAVGLSVSGVVDQVNKALALAGITSALAVPVNNGATWSLTTLGIGEFQFINIKTASSPAVLTAFQLGAGRTYKGLSFYNQYIVGVPFLKLPDPRGNLDELAIEASSVRVFLGTGSGGFLEASRTSAFLRNGTVDHSAVTAAGSVDLVAAFPSLTTTTFSVKVNGGTTQIITFATPGNAAAVLSQITSQLTGATPSLSTVGNGLVLTSTLTGAGASIQILAGGSALSLLGVTAQTVVGNNISVIDDGNGDQVSPLVKFTGQDFVATATAATTLGTSGTYPLTLGTTLIISDGSQEQTIVFTASASVAAAVTEINAVISSPGYEPLRGNYITAVAVGATIRLTHQLTGVDSVIKIVGGTALAGLGLAAGTFRPTATSVPRAGDEVYINGALVGAIAEVAPGGAVDTLRIAVQQTISLNIGSYFYIRAIGTVDGTIVGRPTAELIVANEMISVKQEMLRDVMGNVVATVAPLYVSYTAVREDVTALARQPGLLRFDNTTQLGEALAPISPANPLAMGLFFALLSAPGIQVTGLGVDAVSADSPFGTVEAFTRAAEYLEAFEVYAIAPLTHDSTVHQIFDAHVTAMSAPTAKGERVVLINPSIPTNKVDKLLASGVNGGTVGSGGLTFDTAVANLTALVQAAGINPIGTIAIASGLFLDLAADSKHYSISSITGSQIVIRTSFTAGTNDDNFYATSDLNDPPLPSILVAAQFAIKVRGGALTVAGIRDLDSTAETIAAIGTGYSNRRVWMTIPDRCAATVGGSEQVLDGFYLNAALVGMIGQNPPQQSFTNFPIGGFTRVLGSNDTFNERQLNVMAAGGAWNVIQEAAGSPLSSRFAITTDLTSVETRTDSITKIVDFTAKFLRRSLRTFIGRFNINHGFLDTLSHVTQGVGALLVDTGVLVGFRLENIVQDENEPDAVLVSVSIDPPYPCNFIRLTLVI